MAAEEPFPQADLEPHFAALEAGIKEISALQAGSQLKQRPGDQPLPVVNEEPDVQSQVIADIEERRKVGIQRYGTALQPHNGRDALRDAYEEAMDLTIYLKQAILERDNMPRRVMLGAEIEDEDDAYHRNPEPELKTPAEWCELESVRVLDSDGWRTRGLDWETPVTKEAFWELCNSSTIKIV